MTLEELKEYKQFIVWKYKSDDKGNKTKVPFSALGTSTGTNEKYRNTWTTYNKAKENVSKYDGIGLIFDNGICGIDIDKRSLDDEVTKEILTMFDTYAEISPSKNGLHILFKADISKIPTTDNGTKLDYKYYQKNPHNGIECYIDGLTNRYFTFTEDTLADKPINDCTEQLLNFLDKYMLKSKWKPQKVKNISKSKSIITDFKPDSEYLKIGLEKDKVLQKLWNSTPSGSNGNESETDLALCNKLAYWCNKDFNAIDTAFKSSPYYLAKDENHKQKWNRQDYKSSTINNSISSCSKNASENNASRLLVKNNSILNDDLIDKLSNLQPHKNYTKDDKGLGELFADIYKDKCRYNVTAKEWYIYNGKIWEEDTGGMQVSRYAKELADSLLVYSTTIEDTSYRDFAVKLGRLNNRKTMLDDSRDKYHIKNDDLDKNTYIFNCQNGVLDLKTFKFNPHNHDDLLSKISNVHYDITKDSKPFEKFINEVMQNDTEKVKYLQKIFGHSLTGDTRLETMFILYGATTRNGKSTLVETIAYMLGNTKGYALTMKPETLAQKQNNDSRQASGDIARLNGCRFLNASEPPKRLIFDVGLLKNLLGRDSITARHLHEREFEFIPIFKLFMNTNYLPLITDETMFTSNRINVITFDRHFSPKEQNQSLKDILREQDNISGIFNWCIDGLKLFYQEGARPPQAVINATEEYRQNSDKLGNFILECLEHTDNNSTAKDVYEVYCKWCEENGYGTENKGNFFAELRTKNIFKETGTVGKVTVRNVVVGYEIKGEIIEKYYRYQN